MTTKATFQTVALLALLAAGFVPAFWQSLRHSVWHPHPKFAVPSAANPAGELPLAIPFFAEKFISDPSPTPSVHAPAIAELAGNALIAIWYGGSREGAKDVALYQSLFDPQSTKWSHPRVVATAKGVQREVGRYIRKIGNPVIMADRTGRVWLFFVTVSFGGWSGSALNVKTSTDGGTSWSPARRLVTSPFLNVSTLVRGGPFQWADGSIAIPIYHEFIGKFGELLRLSEDGQVLDKERLTWGRFAIQPVIMPLDERNALALARNCGDPSRAILGQRTEDAGASWSSPVPLALPNPDASVAALRLRGGSLLLAYNHALNARRNLSLALSKDNGRTWVQRRTIEEAGAARAGEKLEYSYPDLGQTADGTVHLVYTWNRTHIKHVAFNESWLNNRQ